MKLAIIGSNREKVSDLVDEAEKIFSDVLYVPVDSIKLEVGNEERAFYQDIDLSTFDIILPIPNNSYREFCFLTLKILEKNCYIPVSSYDLFTIKNRALLMKRLIKGNLKVRKSAILASNRTSKMLIKNLKFPITVKSPSGKRVNVTNEETLKNVLSIYKAGNLRILEKPLKAKSVIWCFVVGDEVVSSYENVNENVKPVNVGQDVRTLILKIKELIKAEYFVVNFINENKSLIINEISLSPNFSLFKEITGKNVSVSLLLHLKDKVEVKSESMSPLIKSFHNLIKKWSRS